MSNRTVAEIVRDYLKREGYDGLYDPGECACKLEELIPDWCDFSIADCAAGYLAPCPPECGEHDWHIQAEKPVEAKRYQPEVFPGVLDPDP